MEDAWSGVLSLTEQGDHKLFMTNCYGYSSKWIILMEF